jgi:hypothetical protein
MQEIISPQLDEKPKSFWQYIKSKKTETSGVSPLRGKDRVSPFRGKDGVSPFRGKDGVSPFPVALWGLILFNNFITPLVLIFISGMVGWGL